MLHHFRVIFILLLLLAGCTTADTQTIKAVSPKEAAGLQANQFAVIVDVRTNEEWQQGHIPGAIHIPLDTLASQKERLKQYQDRTLIMQCRSGHSSAQAVTLLQEAGFQNVVNLQGGILAWHAAHLPIE